MNNNREKDCPFSKWEQEEILIEKNAVVALVDPYPVADGHALVIPKRHVTQLGDFSEEEVVQIFECITYVQSLVTNADGFNIGFNQGKAAGQSIPHMHCHVIPRKFGDVENPQGGVRSVLPRKQHYTKSE